MFGKSGKSKGDDPLAQRMRQITTRAASDEDVPPVIDNVAAGGRAPRKPTFKQATITLRTGERMDVVVKNVSDTGARIEFFRNVHLTEHVLVSEPTLKLKKWARVMWQGNGAAGLQFIDT